MPEQWETYYLMVGSSSAALIGLLFVVMTLAGDIESSRADIAQRIFLTPVIVNFGVIVVISCAALAPERAWVTAAAVTVSALIGLFYGARALARLLTGATEVQHWTDYWFYGVFPTANHLLLIAGAVGIAMDSDPGLDAVALGAMTLLILSIRNAWDLAVWLTYHRKGT
jgi:hypothetical protein